MPEKSHLSYQILALLAGALLGVITVLAAVLVSFFAAIYEPGFGYVFAAVIPAGLAAAISPLHRLANERLKLPHAALIVSTCIIPAVTAVIYRCSFVIKAAEGYKGFMAGLSYAVDDYCSMFLIISTAVFVLARVVTAIILVESPPESIEKGERETPRK